MKTEVRKILEKDLEEIDEEAIKELRNKLQITEEENSSLTQEIKRLSAENKKLRAIIEKASSVLVLPPSN
ncbi:MAG: hypothetical protein IIZ39_01505 [Blautia sp.]|nr:hypothetical protein [Blautia sp.]